MSNKDNFIINLQSIERQDALLQFNLDDSFFATLDQDEVQGGDVAVEVRIHFGSADTFTFHYTIRGNVIVPCDRCLDLVSIPLDFQEEIKVAYENDDTTDADINVIPYSQLSYDIAWDIYELIALELPLQRIHDYGECNIDMLSRFSTEQDSDDEDFDFKA